MPRTMSTLNPFLAEDGMVHCPKKSGQAIAIGRCATMRDGHCDGCAWLTAEPPEREINASSTRGSHGYEMQHPYTATCLQLGHRPNKTGFACLTCGGSRPAIAPRPCKFSKSSTHLKTCPAGCDRETVTQHGCQWACRRSMGQVIVNFCVFSRILQEKQLNEALEGRAVNPQVP